jgi:hypothetical protein
MMRFFPQSSDNELPVLVWTGTDEDTTDCAWCMTEQGQDLGNGSHGICGDHSASLLKKFKADKAKRSKDRH